MAARETRRSARGGRASRGAALAALCACALWGSAFAKPSNIVLILTDDQDVQLGGLTPMKKTKSLIGDAGVYFSNAFVATPLCCPSRSSILTGKYPHNHEVRNNSLGGNCSSPAWQQGPEMTAFPVFLGKQLYQTFYAGKYLNQVRCDSFLTVPHLFRVRSLLCDQARGRCHGLVSWLGRVDVEPFFTFIPACCTYCDSLAEVNLKLLCFSVYFCVSQAPVLNIDLGPTFLDIAGVNLSQVNMDGQSFLPQMAPSLRNGTSRPYFLVEYIGEGHTGPDPDCPKLGSGLSQCFPDCVCEDAFNNTYACVRTLTGYNMQYCEFADSESFVEVYNLTADPHQLENIVKKVDPTLLQTMNQRLIRLQSCVGSSCRDNKY
nr:N-acetylglucosamine-6-sulfatase-like [Paramormyrops kingsleyae]